MALEQFPKKALSGAGQPSWIAPVKPVVPDHELLVRIGGGSYGDVWLARSVVGTWRAVKVVFRDRFLDAKPFEREFSGIQKFEPLSRGHEGFIDILQIGRNDADGYFYYVMELADDASDASDIRPETYVPKTLAKALLQSGRLPVSDCLELGVTLNLGLAKLHEAGLIHRDIKPSNIIFVGGVPKLADIGLVIEVAEARSYVGTEGFIPPEGPNSPQADIYSLGKVLYEAGMGKDRKDFPEPLTQIGQAPDSTDLLEFNAVLLKACAANLKDRYQSAGEMNADLALLQSGGSVRRQRKVAGQLRLARRGGIAVTALIALVGIGWLWQARETRIVRELAAAKARLVTERTQLAETNRARLVRLNVSNGLRQMEQGDIGSALVWLSQALELATNNSADASAQRGRIHHLLSQHPRLLHILPHPASVRSAEFSPDEQRVLTACMDGSVRIWDAGRDEHPVAEFHFEHPVKWARFTHDGERIFTVQLDQLNQLERAAVLDGVTGKPLFSPSDGVTFAAFSPDDRWLAVAKTNLVVQVISVQTGNVVAEAKGHRDRIEMVAFSPDSKEFLTASRDRTVRRWEVATGLMIGSPLRHSQPVSRSIFNCDATRIATATAAEERGTAIQFQIWNGITGAAVGKTIAGNGGCTVLAFDASGRKLLTGDSDGAFVVRDAESQAIVAPQLQIDSPAHVIDFSPDGALVALGTERGNARMWDLEAGNPKSPLLRHASRTEHLRFNGDGSLLLTASDDGTVKMWELAQLPDDGYLSLKASDHASSAISPDGQQLLLRVAGDTQHLQLVNVNPLKEAGLSIPSADEVNPWLLTFDRSGNQWAIGSGPNPYELSNDGRWTRRFGAGLWRRNGDSICHYTLAYSGMVRGVFFNEDGRQLLTVCGDRQTRIWNTADASLLQTIPWPEDDLAWVVVAPDLRTSVALIRDTQGEHFVLRDVQTGKRLGPSPESNPDINAAAFSPDGMRVVTVGDNQCGRIWDARTGEPLTPYFKHGGVVTSVSWSPDGSRVITAGQMPEAKVWDAATGRLTLPPLAMKAKKLKGSNFSADGRFIVAWSEDKFVRVWDAGTGEAITPLLPHWDHILAAFVTSNSVLVTVSGPCVVRVWDLSPSTVPTQDLADYASLLAGGSIRDPSGSRPLSGTELATLLRSLRSHQPRLFAASAQRLCDWHRRRVSEALTPSEARASIFHLERLTRLFPEDTTVGDQLNRCRALLIPARESQTPPRLLDLTRAYTHSLDQQRFGDFAELPRGRQILGNIEYDLRGVIELDHRAEWTGYAGPFHPMAAILVGQRCERLHFLQATEGDPNIDGSIVAYWVIHYVDGSTQEWPIIYGDQVRSLGSVAAEVGEARKAKVVWRGRKPAGHLWHTEITEQLYESTWINPQPALEIARLEFRVGETALKPLVVAITAE